METLTKAVPGCVEAVFLLAQAKYLSGLTSAAQSGAQYCLHMTPGYADAHLLMAQVGEGTWTEGRALGIGGKRALRRGRSLKRMPSLCL